MILTDEEKQMRDGAEGAATAAAMDLLIRYITAIRAIRVQNANFPISECSACELPSSVAAAGGASAMHNIYILGSIG